MIELYAPFSKGILQISNAGLFSCLGGANIKLILIKTKNPRIFYLRGNFANNHIMKTRERECKYIHKICNTQTQVLFL